MATIEVPTMFEPRQITKAWTALPSWLHVPDMGVLSINSFLLKGDESVLVDTGLGALGDEFLSALQQEIDLDDLRWIWLSHMDADHIGNLTRVLERAPNVRILTNFLGMAKLNLAGLDISRVRLLEPGEVLNVGGHRLNSVRPPYYDAPETIGFFDEKDRVLFSADSFGAVLPEPASEIGEIPDETLRYGLVAWSSVDAPWLAAVDQAAFGRTLSAIEQLDPDFVLSGHLPLARKGVRALTRHVADAYCRGPSTDVDRLSLEHLSMTLDAAPADSAPNTVSKKAVTEPTDAVDIIARNRATVERFLAGTHSHDIADAKVIDDTVVPDIVCHGFPNGMNPHDHASYKAFFEIFRQSFGDMDFAIDALVADERFVSVRWRVSCVHSGAFAGIEPSGRRVEFDGMVLYRMEDGLIAETWLHINELGLLGQIGAVPALTA